MKKFVLILLAAIAMTACDFETSGNGDLDGFWQLRQLDTLSTHQTADMRQSGIYWCVQHKLLELFDVNSVRSNIFFRFEKTATQLRLYEPICDNRQISDSIITTTETLLPYGIQHLEEKLLIESFSADEMVLKNEKFRFHFRKY